MREKLRCPLGVKRDERKALREVAISATKNTLWTLNLNEIIMDVKNNKKFNFLLFLSQIFIFPLTNLISISRCTSGKFCQHRYKTGQFEIFSPWRGWEGRRQR